MKICLPYYSVKIKENIVEQFMKWVTFFLKNAHLKIAT